MRVGKAHVNRNGTYESEEHNSVSCIKVSLHFFSQIESITAILLRLIFGPQIKMELELFMLDMEILPKVT